LAHTIERPERSEATMETRVEPARSDTTVFTLREFDWSGLVRDHFFTSQLAGIVGTIVGLSALSGQALPAGLLVDPSVSLVCIVLAFTRVWKSNREEQETMHLWEQASAGDQDQRLLDRVVEIPYVFLVLALPLTASLPQVFMATLFGFYLFDNHYNAALARIAGRASNPTSTGTPSYARLLITALRRSLLLGDVVPADATRSQMVGYFRTRSRYNSLFMAVLVAAFGIVTMLKLNGSATAAWAVAMVALLAIFLAEWLIEPLRNRGMTFEPDPET
jgi:hypothetical protein